MRYDKMNIQKYCEKKTIYTSISDPGCSHFSELCYVTIVTVSQPGLLSFVPE